MPIPEQGFDAGPLGALASNRVGYMNLPPAIVDYSGLTKPLFEASQLQYKANDALTQAQLKAYNDQLLEKFKQGQENYRTGAQLSSQEKVAAARDTNQWNIAQLGSQDRQAALAETTQYHGGLLQNDQAKIGLQAQGLQDTQALHQAQIQNMSAQQQAEQQKIQQEQVKQDLNAHIMLGKEDNNKMGALYSGAAAVMAYSNNDPKALHTYLSQNVQDGKLTQAQADQVEQQAISDPNAFRGYVTQKILTAGMAGTALNTIPGYRQVSPETQQKNMEKVQQLTVLQQLGNDVVANTTPDKFGVGGAYTSWVGGKQGELQEIGKAGIPLISPVAKFVGDNIVGTGSIQGAAERATYQTQLADWTANTTAMYNQMKGASSRNYTILQNAAGSINKDPVTGPAMVRALKAINDRVIPIVKAQAMGQQVDTTHVDQQLQGQFNLIQKLSAPDTQVMGYYSGHPHTMADVKEAAQTNHTSVEQELQRLQDKP